MKKGFTIAEIMVTLLIIAVVMAASAPVITKRSARTAGGAGNNPWEWIGSTASAKYNSSGANAIALIGTSVVPDDITNLPRLLISSDTSSRNQITFYQGENNYGSISLNKNGIAIGVVEDVLSTMKNQPIISIGNTSVTDGSIAMGHNTTCGEDSIAISNATASAANSIAIGHNSVASGVSSIAFGSNTSVSGANSVVIGNGSAWGGDDVIMLALNYGSSDTRTTGYPPHTNTSISVYSGNEPLTLPANNIVLIGGQQDTVITSNNVFIPATAYVGTIEATNVKTRNLYSRNPVLTPSDKRLKSIKKENKNGLEKINKLKVYDYTLNSDPKKKRVGIIAQELMKVFPDAVSKDENGYYFVREEDIFFALVNAVKEIDLKIKKVIISLANLDNDYTSLENKLDILTSKTNKNSGEITILKQEVLKLEKRMNSLNSKNVKVSK